jgi:hypothetical protein
MGVIIMTASLTHEKNKSDAQRAADREADERWMRDHAPVYVPPTTPAYRPAVASAVAAVASAH